MAKGAIHKNYHIDPLENIPKVGIELFYQSFLYKNENGRCIPKYKVIGNNKAETQAKIDQMCREYNVFSLTSLSPSTIVDQNNLYDSPVAIDIETGEIY